MEPMVGVIQNVIGGPVGLADSISYDVQLNTPNGVTTIKGVRPSVDRWPDPIEVRAFTEGKPVLFSAVGNRIYMMQREIPDFGPCEQNPGNAIAGVAGLFAAVASMSREEKAMLRRMLEV